MGTKKDLSASKQKSRFFRKDENGDEVFYPWGYPGEGFYVDEKQKRDIKIFLYLIISILFSGFVLWICTYQATNEDFNRTIFLFTVSLTIFPMSYILFTYRFCRNLKPHISALRQIPLRNILTILLTIFFQFLFMIFGVYLNQGNSLLIVIFILSGGIYCGILLFILILTLQYKNYFLQK